MEIVMNTKKKSSQKEQVNHPDHYNWLPDIECSDVADHFNFNLGNVIKYVWRAGYKDALLQELKKARWYINREIARLEKRDNQ